jgi:hypothetical protein
MLWNAPLGLAMAVATPDRLAPRVEERSPRSFRHDDDASLQDARMLVRATGPGSASGTHGYRVIPLRLAERQHQLLRQTSVTTR